jgi:phosphotransacetylase
MTVINERGKFYLNRYLETLYQLMIHQYKLQSDFARSHAFIIAEAASRGHVTSILSGVAQNSWFVTSEGHKLLKKEGYV